MLTSLPNLPNIRLNMRPLHYNMYYIAFDIETHQSNYYYVCITVQSKFTNTARALVKLCRQEMQHIENCPDCYLNSHTRSSDSWFTEACVSNNIVTGQKIGVHWTSVQNKHFYKIKTNNYNQLMFGKTYIRTVSNI